MKAKRFMTRQEMLAERKQAAKQMKKVTQAINNHPTECHDCGAEFDRTVPGALDAWHITTYDDGVAELTCPDCQQHS